MKKKLSIFLVVAMLICMVPAFGIFAAEADLTTIDTPDELVALADAANAAGRDYRAGETIKVTANLDMTGKTYNPIKQGLFILDFDGHTLSNLDVTVNDAPGDVGLLAYRLENGNGGNGLITNLKIKDCSLTVNGTGSVRAGIVGYADRANVTNVEIDGFDITMNTVGYVGTLMGGKAWGYDSDIKATIKNVTIDAPYANVGVVIGMTEGSDNFNLTELDSSITVKNSFNDIADDTYLASGDKLVCSEGLKSTVADQMDGKRTDYSTIDSPEEFAELTKLANKGVAFSGTIKVTKDLDMKAITDFQPIEHLKFNLDFDGHTVSNLSVTTSGTAKDDSTYAGLIAGFMYNGTMILNLKLSNCELNTNAFHVGIVAGKADRAIVPNVEMEKVTLNAEGAYLVGGVIGDRQWDLDLGDREGNEADMTAELNNVVINADGATLIGILAGRTGGDARINVVSVKTENVTINNNKEGFDASAVSYIGEIGDAEKVTEAEGAVIDIKLSETATGYEEPEDAPAVDPDDGNTDNGNTDNGNTDNGNTNNGNTNNGNTNNGNTNNNTNNDKPAKTGDVTLVAVVLAVVALVGAAVISKKRSAC